MPRRGSGTSPPVVPVAGSPVTIVPADSVERGGVLAGLAAYGLAGTRHVLPVVPLQEADWVAVLHQAGRQQLMGLLAAAIADGAFPTTDAQFEDAADLHVDVALVSVFLERLLIDVADRLDEHGIELRVLKGPARAHLDYPDPSLRCFSDIDILVRTTDFGDAVAALEQMGGVRTVPEIRPGFDRRFGKGATMAMPGDFEVDVHRTFVAGPLGHTIDHDALFATTSSFELADRKLEGLATEERFLHACLNAGLDRPAGLHALRDIAQFALATNMNLDHCYDLAQRWQAQAVIARAVNLTWTTLDLADATPLTAWANRYRPTKRDTRLLHAYLGGNQSYTRQALAAIRAIPRQRDRIAYTHALLFPTQAHLTARGTTRLQHLKHATRHL